MVSLCYRGFNDGQFGYTYVATDKANGDRVAAKKIDKNKDHVLYLPIVIGLAEEVDVNMEWLSIFVEDCLSSSGNCMPSAAKPQSTTSTAEAGKLLHEFKFHEWHIKSMDFHPLEFFLAESQLV
ncbi:hypothetical protein L2E82_14874 [Cichorium intybus]|uniref:Uncharacterized protein n=1 Tax=Cichorium intybus TaxID=13427 RepID=A0ACB9F199_CICIN|nr:hypothetical protein L2E82_14874 [Cichorium intybus]